MPTPTVRQKTRKTAAAMASQSNASRRLRVPETADPARRNATRPWERATVRKGAAEDAPEDGGEGAAEGVGEGVGGVGDAGEGMITAPRVGGGGPGR
ncbi:hypothetical protein GCM10010156_28800 [Planobispora rosea]|uniref:Uncharacterized protein n=1 Tax=Planobispora rosea TaxID=35762 RepID=A0A8J3RXD8_PLARO|nr:hypothetical protein GCM10010156_28800 [Planobispora rosea]GIH81966.1 hypothetical protein Pro02_03740 [Planobispora rosea]